MNETYICPECGYWGISVEACEWIAEITPEAFKDKSMDEAVGESGDELLLACKECGWTNVAIL